jgi:hypothetical protein
MMVTDDNVGGEDSPVGVIRGQTCGELTSQFIDLTGLNTVIDLTENLLRKNIRIDTKTLRRLTNALKNLVETDRLLLAVALKNSHTKGHREKVWTYSPAGKEITFFAWFAFSATPACSACAVFSAFSVFSAASFPL